MAEVMKKIERGGPRAGDYCNIISRPETEPLFSSQLLDFWCPIGSISGYREKLEVGLCSIKEDFDRFDRMERHQESEEIIIPFSGDLFIPVAPPDRNPDPEKVRILLVHVGEIINLYPGVWHFACGPVQHVTRDNPLEYFVFLKSGTPTDDLEMVELPQAVRILR